MKDKRYLFIGSRLEVLKEMIKLKLPTTALILQNTFAAKVMKGVCTTFESKKELLKLISSTPFDILVSNGCPFILPVSKLKRQGQVFINLHPSLLPKFRGLNPVNASILFKEKAGATCHLMSDDLDKGDIIAWQKIHNDESISLSLLYQLCFLAEARAFKKAYKRKFKPFCKQDEAKSSYYTRKDEDMILNLNADSDELLLCKVRAFSQKGQRAKLYQKGKCFEIQNAKIVKNKFLNQRFKSKAFNDIVLRYENNILIKRSKGFLELCLIAGGGGLTLNNSHFSRGLYV